jgi:thiol-disulfide isomerase/thioredoxin
VTRTVRVGSLVAVVLVAGLVAFLATRPVAQEATSVDSPLIGTSAPALSTTTLSGAPFSLAAQRGHVVVLTFFSSWCPPCRTEAPELAAYAYRLGATHSSARLYGVVFNDVDSAAAGFLRTYGGGYRGLRDPGGRFAGDLAVTSPPVTVVVAANGRIASILDGAVTAAQLGRVVDVAQRSAT